MDIKQIKKDFPILDIKVNNKPLIYLDNAATTQKPLPVIEAISEYYQKYNANVHRGVHTLSQIATDKFEQVREQIRKFINAEHSSEIVYTRGTTESLNLLASSLSHYLQEGDEIIVSESEHHSNIVPWQMACERTKAKLRVLPINDDGTYADVTLLGENINTEYNEYRVSGYSLGADKSTPDLIIYSSDRKYDRAKGGYDLYLSVLKEVEINENYF